jgi:hypothetical protein
MGKSAKPVKETAETLPHRQARGLLVTSEERRNLASA